MGHVSFSGRKVSARGYKSVVLECEHYPDTLGDKIQCILNYVGVVISI